MVRQRQSPAVNGATALTLAVTGDLQLSHALKDNDGGLAGNRGPRTTYDLLRTADLAFVNLETPLTLATVPAEKLVTFKSDPGLAPELKRAGVDVATVANNHALDYGMEGLRETVGTLEEAGVAVVGAGDGLAAALAPRVIEARGVKVAFLGVACTLPPGSAAAVDRPGIGPIHVFTRFVVDGDALLEQPGAAPYVETTADPGDVEHVLEAVRSARSLADIVVVGIHWGVPHGFVAPFQNPLADYQRPLAHAIVEAGARVIVGNHAHVLHGIERRGAAVIFYSLGNFLFHHFATGAPLSLKRAYPPYDMRSLRSRISRLSCLPLVRVSPRGVEQIEIVPLLLGDDGEPRVGAGDEAREVLELLDRLSRAFGTTVIIEGDRGFVRTLVPRPESTLREKF